MIINGGTHKDYHTYITEMIRNENIDNTIFSSKDEQEHNMVLFKAWLTGKNTSDLFPLRSNS
jgi:hypothetical protein